MKTLDKYVAKEMIAPYIAGFAAVLILWIGNIIYNQITLIVQRLHQWPLVLYYIFLQTPYFIMLSLPAGALFGCSLALSRLARDSETTMMCMAGIKAKRIILPVLVIGALTSGLAYLFQEQVTSWAGKQSARVQKLFWQTPGAPPIQQNVFFRADNYYFYVNTVARRGHKMELEEVMVYEPPTGRGFPALTTARYAAEESNVWTLKDGVTYRVNEVGDPILVGRFKDMKLDLRRALTDYFFADQKTPATMNLHELREQLNVLEKSGQKTNIIKLEYGFKLAIPLSSLVLVLCVAPLSLKFGRSGGFMGILIAIIVLFFYWNVLIFSRVLGEAGAMSPILAGWSSVIVFTILGSLLMWKVE